MNLIQGLVIKSTGSWYEVVLTDGTLVQARIRGNFRLQGSKATNPIAVGDQVKLFLEEPSGNGIIESLDDRRNYMVRKSNKLSKQTQVIASNLDLAGLVITIMDPPISQGFVDRFLVTAEVYHIPALIILNKSDLFQFEEAREQIEEWKMLYTGLGYFWFEVSAKTGLGIEELRTFLKDKTTLLSGHSGVGKTSLLNELIPGIDKKTGIISTYSGKGKHTTTFAEMFSLPNGGKIVDTPGIREFGVVNVADEEISHYFPEMRRYMAGCRFNNCMHTEEPDCAVKKALEQGEISAGRYYSYLSILANEETLN